MNILFVAAYPPVLNQHGGGSRMFHNIRVLAEHHRVHLLSFAESDGDFERLKTLEGMCASVRVVRRIPDFRPHWFSWLPFTVREFDTPEMHEAVDQLMEREKIDVLQCEYIQAAQFWRSGLPALLTNLEVQSYAWQIQRDAARGITARVRSLYRWMQYLNYEVRITRQFDTVVTMTEEDERYLSSYARTSNVRTIPIGVDADVFSVMQIQPAAPLEVVFLGNYRHTPNAEAAVWIADRVAPRFPDVRFILAGGGGMPAVTPRDNLSVVGYVEDPLSIYHRPNAIFFAPLFSGRGQRVKLLEAFSCGLPVLTTSLGAAGYRLEHRREAWIANGEQSLLEGLHELIASPDLRIGMGAAARRFIEENLTWKVIGPRMVEAVEELARRPASRSRS